MKVAIVGSRKFFDLDRVRAYVRALPEGTVIISGGAAGVDQAAALAAHGCGFVVREHLPDYAKHARGAPLRRNEIIARECDRLVAFWDGKSRGTMHTIGVARKLGKSVEIVEVR